MLTQGRIPAGRGPQHCQQQGEALLFCDLSTLAVSFLNEVTRSFPQSPFIDGGLISFHNTSINTQRLNRPNQTVLNFSSSSLHTQTAAQRTVLENPPNLLDKQLYHQEHSRGCPPPMVSAFYLLLHLLCCSALAFQGNGCLEMPSCPAHVSAWQVGAQFCTWNPWCIT